MDEKMPQSLSPRQIILVLAAIAAAVEIAAVICNILISPYPYGRDMDMDDYISEADASARGGIIYLTDDEVKEAGLSCTELEHFDFSAESLFDDLRDIFELEDLNVSDIETDSYNQVYGDGGSWYETLVTFFLEVPGDDTGYQRLTLNYDTATGGLHEIDIFLSDEKLTLSLTADLLEMLDARTGTFGPDTCEEAVEELERSLSRRENLCAAFGESGSSDSLALTLYCYEDGYSIYIARE